MNFVFTLYIITLMCNNFQANIFRRRCQWMCDDGVCIDRDEVCNGIFDCADKSDETNKICATGECLEGEWQCKDGKCLRGHLLCDSFSHCDDESDETVEACANYTCGDDRWKCDYGGCIEKCYACDGKWDCLDNSDEETCGNTTCRRNFWRCDYGACIEKTKVCNGAYDCLDDSDETEEACENVVCESDQWRCDTGQCIGEYFVCDGKNDCLSGSDENATMCANRTCGRGKWKCGSGRCINEEMKCDGTDECPDGSDDTTEVCANNTCSDTQWRCDYGGCIELIWACDNQHDCWDESDETMTACANNTCESDQWRCDYGACIYEDGLCDGIYDCADKSDETEKACANNTCSSNKWRCDNGACIPKFWVCSGEVDCADNSDETKEACSEFNSSCEYNESWQWKCDYGGCINEDDVCNNRFDCVDESDEANCEVAPSIKRPINCKNSQQYISSLSFCDAKVECVHGDDEDSINDFMKSHPRNKSFPCQNKLIKHTQVCNLQMEHVCDNITNCRYGADECFCRNGKYFIDAHYHNNCFKCLNNALIIPQYKVCDGTIDCEDSSDECLCGNNVMDCSKPLDNDRIKSILSANQLKLFWSEYYGGKDLENFLCCLDQGCQRWLSKEVNCLQCMGVAGQYSIKGDGIPTCEIASSFYFEECVKVSPVPTFCQYFNNSLLPGTMICNGYDDGRREENGCTHRFYCNTSISEPINIGKHKVCNGIADCFDQSDEMNCSESTHYYCKAGNMDFISVDKVCDGREDCDDSTDECQDCLSSPFSDDYRLVANRGIWFLLLIAASTSLFGNLYRIFVEFQCWYKQDDMTPVGKNNSLLLLSLAFADLCVSVYLWGLVIANEATSKDKKYCHEDKDWRMSTPCKSLGVLMFVGSQASVSTLVSISVYRLYSSIRPLVVRAQGIKNTVYGICLIWISSFILGLIPIFASEDYFITYVEYTTNPLMVKIDKFNNSIVARNLVTIINKNENRSSLLGEKLMTWNEIEKSMRLIHPDLQIKYKYHYYSKHGTCLPDFYPNPSTDISYVYSAGIAIFDAGCFLIIAACYLVVYWNIRESNKVVKAVNERSTMNAMQRKIALIIITDMMCWLPIGLTAICSIAGVVISEEMYVATATFLLPINSVVNPLIYSDTMDKMTMKLKLVFGRCCKKKQAKEDIPMQELTA